MTLTRWTSLASLLSVAIFVLAMVGSVHAFESKGNIRKQLIPILATALDQDRNPVGVVAELEVALWERNDHKGMDVRFEGKPGRFSRRAQVAVVSAILDLARVANMSTDSWTISLIVPYRGVTVYGTSLSAMVGLTVIALAHGDFVKPDRVVTGTVTSDGHIGPVSGIGLKLEAAASGQRLRRVLVPEEYDISEGDWHTPFLLHVSPVGTVLRAYEVLTDQKFPLRRLSRS